MYDLDFLADGRLATAGQDGVTRVWDAVSGQQLLNLASGASTVISVAAARTACCLPPAAMMGRFACGTPRRAMNC
jgi:hypothetical protein